MKKIIISILLVGCALTVNAQDKPMREVGKCSGAVIEDNGDTLYLASLHDLYVYPTLKFKNKKQEKFYWRTVRDVKVTLPYAKEIAKELDKTSTMMASMSKKDQKKFWKQYEKLLMAKYEGSFRNMTASQGQMLMLLVDRECEKTSYECIKLIKGKACANFWQGIAKLFGNDLKESYDGSDKDKIVERIITLVEAGQV